MEGALEELAAEHKYASLRRDARHCSAVMKTKVGLHLLAPTEAIPGLVVPGQGGHLGQNCLKRTVNRAVVCPPGAAVWFEEKKLLSAQAKPALVSACAFAMGQRCAVFCALSSVCKLFS